MNGNNLDMIVPLHNIYFNNLAKNTGHTEYSLNKEFNRERTPVENLSILSTLTRALIKSLFTKEGLTITTKRDEDGRFLETRIDSDEISLRSLDAIYPTHIRLYGEEMVKRSMPAGMKTQEYKDLCKKNKAKNALKLLGEG